MASTIRIKRSGTSGNPSVLGQGELAYSYLADNGSNGGDRLYIGTGTEIAGNAVNHEVIGGKFFTDMLDHDKGVLVPNSALIVDADKKIDELTIDDIKIDGNTISALTGGITFDTSGNEIDFGGVQLHGVATPVHDSDAANKSYVDNLASNFYFSFSGDEGGTDTFVAQGGTLTFTGGTGLTSSISDDQVSFELDSTSVTAGSYGSQTAIPTFTVDAQGRLTAASTVDVATNLTVNNDAISLLDSDLTFTATGNGFNLTYTESTNTVDYSIDDATVSSKGVAQFNDDDFDVTSGEVFLEGTVLKSVSTDSGDVTPSSHIININGNDIQGIDVTGSGNTVNVTAKTATYDQMGVAKFNSGDFQLNSGDVSIDSDFVRYINTDDGALGVTGHQISILGGEGINVTHTGTNIEVAGEEATDTNLGIASFANTDFDVVSGAVSIKAGGVSNAQLVNDGITIGDNDTDLGATVTDLTGLTGATIDDIRIDGNKISTNSSQPDMILDPKGGDSNGGKVVIYGDLQVEGTQTIINSTAMTVNDLTLTLADSAADATAANGAGIIIDGADAQMTYTAAGDKWEFNKTVNVTGSDLTAIQIGGTTLQERMEDHLANSFFTVGEGLDITYGSSQDSDNVILFSAELSSYTNKGVASFDSDQFMVTSGYVSVNELDGGIY
jgi:hypothetical protein